MNTQIIKVEEVQELVLSAPAALNKNQSIMLAGVKQAEELFARILDEGMSTELDQACNDWQVKAKKGLILMDDNRKPITQMLDAIKKKFIELEAPLDSKKADSYYAKIQTQRNEFAKKMALEEQKRQEEIIKVQQRELEFNQLRSHLSQQLIDAEIQLLFRRKGFITAILDNATLADIDAVKQKLMNLPLPLQTSKFDAIEISLPRLIYVTPEEARAELGTIRHAKYLELYKKHEEVLTTFRDETISAIPSKRAELQEIEDAKNDGLKQAALNKQAYERKLAEDAKLKKEEEEARKKSEDDAVLQKEIDNANTLFNSASEMANGTQSSASVRQGFKIIVLSPVGFQQIAAFWFQKEGMNLTIEALEKKSLGQMKTFCEKYYHNTGEKIDSSALKYEQDFKAVAKKS